MDGATIETHYDLVGASRLISGIALQTPVLRSVGQTARPEVPILLKLENLQVTGSFKVRGAANRMLSLGAARAFSRCGGCSSGNHGRAVAVVVVDEWRETIAYHLVGCDSRSAEVRRVEPTTDSQLSGAAPSRAISSKGDTAAVAGRTSTLN